MKKYLFILFSIVSSGMLSAQPFTPGWQWAQGASSLALEAGTDVCADANGYVYTVGVIDSTATIGSQQLSDGSFIAKYTADGTCLWSKLLPGGNAVETRSIVSAKDGSIYINGTLKYPCTIGSDSISPAGIFIAKFDTAGNIIWARGGGNTVDEIIIHNCSVDENSNVTVVANTHLGDDINFGGNIVSGSGTYMVRYNASGDLLLEKFLFKKGQADILSIATDVAGNIYASGFCGSDSVMLDDGTLLVNPKRFTSALIIKYTPSGDIIWAKTTSGGAAMANAIAADKNGTNIYVTGEAEDTVNFGNVSSLPDYFGQLFVAKCDSSGAALWVKRFGGPGNTLSAGTYEYFATDIIVDDNGNINTGGNFHDKLMFSGSHILTDAGPNIYTAQFNPTGTFNWALAGGGRFGTNFGGMCSAGEGIYTIGTYSGANAVFGFHSLVNSTNTRNLFFARIADVTGINTTSKSAIQATAYPNPAHNTITVDHISTGTAIRVVDVAGKVFLGKTAASEKETINIAALLPGIYLLQLADNDTNTKSFRIEKQ